MSKPNDQFSMSKLMGRQMKDKNTLTRILVCMLLLFMTGMTSKNGQVAGQIISLNEQDSNFTESPTIQLEFALEQMEDKFDVSFVYESGLLNGMRVNPEDLLQSDNFGKELQQLIDPFDLTFTSLNERTFIIKKK